MTHKLLAVASIAVLVLPVVSAWAQYDEAATAADSPPATVSAAGMARTGSTIVENLLNLPPEFVPSTADEHLSIHL